MKLPAARLGRRPLCARSPRETYARDHLPPGQRGGRVGICQRRRVCLRQQTTAMGWRRQLPAVQFNRSRHDAGALDRFSQPSDRERCVPFWKKMQGDALAFQCPQARAIHPLAVGKLHGVIICRELSDADQIIKSEHYGTDRTAKYADPEPPFSEAAMHRREGPLRALASNSPNKP